MKKVKIFTMLICIALLTGCAKNVNTTASSENIPSSSDSKEQTRTLTVITGKSPASIPLLRMTENNSMGKTVKIDMQVFSTQDKMMALVSSGKYDVLLTGANVASTLYNKGLNIQLMSTYNWGGMYLSTTDPDCKSWEDLKGKELYVPSKGSLPDLLTQYCLKKNKLEIGKDIEVVYSSSHATIAQLLSTGTIKYAVDAQPYVTANKQNIKNYKVICNYSEQWKTFEDGCSLPASCTALNSKTQNADLIKEFNEKFSQTVKWTVENPDEAGKLAKTYLNADAELMSKAMPGFQFEYKSVADAKKDIVRYFNVLLDMKPDSIGGKLPDDEFYYAG